MKKNVKCFNFMLYLGSKMYGNGNWKLPGGVGKIRGKHYKKWWWRIYKEQP